MKGEHLKITQPHTPQLMTRQRSRPTLVKSHTALEAEEAEKMQKYDLGAKRCSLFLASHLFMYSPTWGDAFEGQEMPACCVGRAKR